MPSRRAFLGLLAGAALDPERALWVPGAKLISIPAPLPVTKYMVFFPARRAYKPGDTVQIAGDPYTVIERCDGLGSDVVRVSSRPDERDHALIAAYWKRFDVALGYGRFR